MEISRERVQELSITLSREYGCKQRDVQKVSVNEEKNKSKNLNRFPTYTIVWIPLKEKFGNCEMNDTSAQSSKLFNLTQGHREV